MISETRWREKNSAGFSEIEGNISIKIVNKIF